MRSKYTKEYLSPIVQDSCSIAEVMRKIGLVPRGSNYKRFNLLITHTLQINTQHFDRNKQQKRHLTQKLTKEQFVSKVLTLHGSGWTSVHIKARLLEFDILPNQCVMCGLSPQWNGRQLVLQLDHINGDSRDNRLDNLRILCPNCHSQTETYNVGHKKGC